MAATGYLMFVIGCVINTAVYVCLIYDLHRRVVAEKLLVVEALIFLAFYLTLVGGLFWLAG